MTRVGCRRQGLPPYSIESLLCSDDGVVGNVDDDGCVCGAGVRELTLVNLSGKVLGYAGR
jgi:hypothetical protein